MKMLLEQALWLQNDLNLLYHDSRWADEFTCFKSTNPLVNWQNSVDVIYRLLICDLARVSQLSSSIYFSGVGHQENVFKYCQLLASMNPDDPEDINLNFKNEYQKQFGFAWLSTEISTTGFLAFLLKKHNLIVYDAGTVNEAFIEELESIFELFGVPWSDEPLVPIQPKLNLEHRKP
jgi:hypothetical protein